MEKVKKSLYPLGSQWRRWDLHIHTPESKLGTSYVGVSWDTYLDSLEAKAEEFGIAAIGITDYMSIDGYERIYKLRNDTASPRLKSVPLVVPNIEFRALPSTKDGKALNIHLLVDPTDGDHISKIKRALKNLKVKYQSEHGETTYGCCRDELIEFGRAQRKDLADDDAAYKFGIEQFKPSHQAIFDWLKTEGWLQANCLVGVANGKDGISGLPAGGFAGTRDFILQNSHFIFSANPADRAYYLGQKKGVSRDEVIRMYRSLKPCIHGSDAHEISAIFVPDEERNCWIKADPTFEGLRQIIWEPEDRVYIGKTSPRKSDRTKIIDAIEIHGDKGWFSDKRIELNEALVAVVGEKGAGKTAIADLISFASGVKFDPASQSSFIAKGKIHLGGVKVNLTWGSGVSTNGILTDKPYASSRPLVRYLSQDFVERLCSSDHRGHELQEAIEDVVFSYLDEVGREGYSSFDELRSSRENASQGRQSEISGQIVSLNREIERIYQSRSQREQKVSSKKDTGKQLDELRKQLPQVEQGVDQAVLKELEQLQVEKREIEGSISLKKKAIRGVDDFLRAYGEIKEEVIERISDAVTTSGIKMHFSEEFRAKLFPRWSLDVEGELSKFSASLQKELDELSGGEGIVSQNRRTLHEVSLSILKLQEKLAVDENNRKALLGIRKQIESLEQLEKRLGREIAEIDGKLSELLKRRIEERDSAYVKYFSALGDDEKGLQELYAPMKSKLDELGDGMRFELAAGYGMRTKEWLERANRFFDGRRPAATAKKEQIESFVARQLEPSWASGDLDKVKIAIEEFADIVDPINFMSKCASPSLSINELMDWMYSTDHIKTTYKIKYGGTSLEHLSPGARGIALLVLYLLMDEDDRRPLIIDQPEGNLDNSSVYEQLVPYIRKAKENRQIILITHNPNLVVATDAEQVIIAFGEKSEGQVYPSISYVSGSLENTGDDSQSGVRQAVCTLLEGGDRAFKEREGRYAIRR